MIFANHLFKKDYVKFIRMNKKYRPIKVIEKNKKRYFVYCQKLEKTQLCIPTIFQSKHVQLHIDQHFQLVYFSYKKLKIKKQILIQDR